VPIAGHTRNYFRHHALDRRNEMVTDAFAAGARPA
jgi:hypothetical protein